MRYRVLGRRLNSRLVLVLCGLAGLLSPGSSSAQVAEVTIRIVSAAGPIEGVQVVIGSSGHLTDEEGQASFQLPIGEYVIRAQRIGFADAQVTLRLAAARDTLVVIQLREQALETEGIIVSSTRTDRRIEEEPLRVEVVSREEVEEKLLMTPGDIAMLLNETEGLRVQTTSPVSTFQSVNVPSSDTANTWDSSTVLTFITHEG